LLQNKIKKNKKMVHITILEELTRLSQHATPMKKWSLRSNGRHGSKSTYANEMIKKIREMLILVSGGDVVELIRDLLTKEETELLIPKYKESLENLV
jgi:hypothetical protein